MTKAEKTREALLNNARALQWRYGYSNVTLRQIAKAAGVDVALVSRYFGGKLGLFEATLEGAFEFPRVEGPEDLVDLVVHLFTSHPRDSPEPTILHLLLMNAQDEEVGPLVREAQHSAMQTGIEAALGNSPRAALFMAAILGMTVAEKSMFLSGIAPCESPVYEAQLRHMLNAAISYKAPTV
jgi:AcrR family transcriptional regulator